MIDPLGDRTMDKGQRDLLAGISGEIAQSTSALDLGQQLVVAKLVSKEKMDLIMTETSSNFCRVLRLIENVQDCHSSTAFRDFVAVLEKVDSKASNILRRHTSNEPDRSAPSILKQLHDTFSRGSYPLGIDSNLFSSSKVINNITSNSCAAEKQWPELQDEQLSNRIEPASIVDNRDAGRESTRVSQLVSWHPYETEGKIGDERSPSLTQYDQDLILNSNVLMKTAHNELHMMSVKKSSVIHNDPVEDYKMTANPRGKCLIVNNIDFDYNVFPTRKGSDEDANRFDQIFQQLGFETIMVRNSTSDQMTALFRDLARACKRENDALFVIILSHGNERGVYGTDGLEVNIEDSIMSCFNNRNCPAMAGKPKVFVIQACRGSSEDLGGDDDDTTDSIATHASNNRLNSMDVRRNTQALASQLQHNSDPTEIQRPTQSDMLLVFSCQAGYVSVRNETAGSWLGVALSYYLMTEAHERDLLRILYMVANDINKRRSTHGHYQSIELKAMGWTKNLYLNPGIYL